MADGGDCDGLEAEPGLGSRGVPWLSGPAAAGPEDRSGEPGGPLLMLLLLSSLLVAVGGGALSRGPSAAAGLALSRPPAEGPSADWGLEEGSATAAGASSVGEGATLCHHSLVTTDRENNYIKLQYKI